MHTVNTKDTLDTVAKVKFRRINRVARLMNRIYATCFALLCGLLTITQVSAAPVQLDSITLPPGFRIHIYADDVPDAQSMSLGAHGTLFVGSRKAGRVYAIVDKNRDGRSDRIYIIAQGLNMPNGVAFLNGSLYVAELSRILRYDTIEDRLENAPEPVIVTDSLPRTCHHGWEFIAVGPDGMLYIPVGAPCNVCERDDKRFSTIMRMNRDGSALEIFVRGVRNSVGFDWHPTTKELWFTDNGRDLLGNDIPPDELNHAPRRGLHFGFPYCHGGDIPDPTFGDKRTCNEFTPPAVNLGPHVAALGMRFYIGTMFPPEFRRSIFIAEHGSWNRKDPIGYRLSVVDVKGTRVANYRTFAAGWLEGRMKWGRPVDVLVMPDGALLVSDDRAGTIYRITYGGMQTGD
jgi:glucose/arabinose dehydrogenase